MISRYAKTAFLSVVLIIALSEAFGVDTIERIGNNRYRVTVSERIIRMTPEEAEREAINKARQKAVEFNSGVEVSSRLINFDAEMGASEVRQYFSNITTIMSQGFIVDQKIIENRRDIVGDDLVVRVTAELEVGVQEGRRDPYFNLNAELNQNTFREGERLVITIVPSQDCYITIINIYSNETTSLIFPNIARDDNFAPANRPYQIPSETDRFSFPLHLLPGKESDVESLLIIATKQRYNFPSFTKLSEYNSYESNLTEIMSQLAKIPRNEMEIEFLEYGVFKR